LGTIASEEMELSIKKLYELKLKPAAEFESPRGLNKGWAKNKIMKNIISVLIIN